jgi:hypothetical protein
MWGRRGLKRVRSRYGIFLFPFPLLCVVGGGGAKGRGVGGDSFEEVVLVKVFATEIDVVVVEIFGFLCFLFEAAAPYLPLKGVVSFDVEKEVLLKCLNA